MKIWVDDIRLPKVGYTWCRTVNGVINEIEKAEKNNIPIEVIDLDHDAGDFTICGGDYIKVLDWLEATDRNYPIHIHTMNPIGRMNMKRIIQKNNWKEII